VVSRDPAAWFRLASSFHLAAILLDNHAYQIPDDSRPFALNAALSLELLFKAILAKQAKEIPTNSHDLKRLCSLAEVQISQHQILTLDMMAEELVWAGRYPAPKQVEKFDNFHDVTMEKHVIRAQTGNTFSTRANPLTFPTIENYEAIWSAGLAVFEA
jgi:HEPN domain-containing protein